jgi:hypothetical protein
MVNGLDVFRAHFRDYADRYLLIGGAACDLLMSAAGAAFRVTKDLDIILCAEALDATFVRAFWDFVRSGGYAVQENSTGQKQFYRFQKPTSAGYPFMLELFSRVPDALQIAPGAHLTPLPMEEEVSSLSAILMDDGYYAFLCAGRTERDGLPVVGAEHLIPLKAHAWLDLSRRRANGETVDSKSIKKHKNDVFRLYQIINPDLDPRAPDRVKDDLRAFIAAVAAEGVDLAALGVRAGTLDDILSGLRSLYRLA